MRTKKTVVILVSGKAGSGKSTVAKILLDKLIEIPEISAMRYAFASPIKFVARSVGGWDGQKDEKGRKLLQDIGRVFREYDPIIWVKHMFRQVDDNSDILPLNFVVVEDWRFLNEYDAIKKSRIMDVVTIRVIGRQAELPGNTASDISEHGLPEAGDKLYDFIIDNVGTIEDLERLLHQYVEIKLSEQYIVE